MANGYLGKISAIVSANTADFDSKLSKSAAEVRKFAGSMQGTLTSAQTGAGNALRGIYTDAQKVERALQAVATQKLRFKGFDTSNLEGAVTKMQAVYSATEQINKPLSSAVRGFNKLSMAVQGEFNAALQVTQASVEKLNAEIDRTAGDSAADFSRLADRLATVAKQVDVTAAAMERLKEVGAMTSGLATGKELRFQRPELSAEMQRSSALQSQASQMSPAAISSNGVASLVAQQRAAALETERLAAALENESLLINGNVAGATAAYQAQLAVQRQLNDEIERRIGAEAAESKGAAGAAEAEIALLQRREQAGKSAEQKRLGTGEFRNLDPDFGTADRKLMSLRSTVASLQGDMERLPLPLQAKFIPMINQVRGELKKLDSTSTSHEIEQATAKAALLGKMLQRAGQGAKLGGTLGDSLNDVAFTRTEKQLSLIRGKLIDVGVTAHGPVATAFNNLSKYAGDAANEGVLGFGRTQKQIDIYIDKLVAAAVAAGNLTVAEGKAFKKGIGDVSRGGVDKYSLALNQAAFAVDDFLSSVGGWDQKLRAVSNNVTQLAFVAGGTKGLFIGLGAVLAGQAAVGLYKWINNGRSAEDQTKALNDALARQKTLVEDLAKAFRSLGDSMSRGLFSAGAEQDQEFSRQLDDIKKKQEESVKNSIVDLDPQVIKERAEQRKLKRKIEGSSDVGEIVGLQTQMEVSKRREKDAADRVASAAPPDLGDVQARIKKAFSEMADAIEMDVNQFNPENPGAGEAAAAPLREKAAGVEQAGSVKEARDQLQTTINELSTQVESGFFNSQQAEAARRQIQTLLATFSSLEAPLMREIDALANEIAEASRGPAVKISQAQEDVADAIKRGVPSAGAFQRELDSSAKKLRAAYDRLEEAQNEDTPEKKQEKVNQANENIFRVNREMAGLDARAREVRLGRTFGGERATSALSGLSGERFANERTGATAKLISAIDAEIQARKNLEAATAKGVDGEIKAAEASLKAAQKASEATAAMAEAAIALEAAITRIRKIGDSAVQKSESGADAAQKSYEDNPFQAGAMEARDAAESRLIEDRARVAKAQADLDNRRNAIKSFRNMIGINTEIESNTQTRKDLEAKAAIGGITPKEQDELAAATKRDIELIRQREQLAQRLTESERKQLDAINNGIAAREKELEKGRQRTAEDPTFKRATDALGQVMAESERQTSEARQRYIENPTQKNFDELKTAEAQLLYDRQSTQELQDSLDNKRNEIEQSIPVVRDRKQIADNETQLAELAQMETAGGLTKDQVDERAALQEDNRQRRLWIENNMLGGTDDERAAIDFEAKQRVLRERGRRGRELGMTEIERFRKDFEENTGADIGARGRQLRQKGEDPTKFLRQAISNQMEQVAPMLKGFEEERQNALIQGPSRKALQVSDVSTSQGASELTRLLRGDDSAKDVNLAELRKQTQKFDALIEIIKQQVPGVLL